MNINSKANLRIDLLGGTLDIYPINIIIPNAKTLNAAIDLKVNITIEEFKPGKLKIVSKDYNKEKLFDSKEFSKQNLNKNHFGNFNLIAHLIKYFNIIENISISIDSDSPPGAGLGGSSAMAIALYKALCKYNKQENFDYDKAVKVVSSLEACVLSQGPTGYQDYYPALYGGLLALHPNEDKITVEQLYDKDLIRVIKEHVTLFYSGAQRSSGVNNWEIYKNFFDGDKNITNALKDIANLTDNAYRIIKDKRYDQLVDMISQEGIYRKKLSKNIISKSIENLFINLKKEISNIGIKICGAGGGGCFLITHSPNDKDKIIQLANKEKMKVIDFNIVEPMK